MTTLNTLQLGKQKRDLPDSPTSIHERVSCKPFILPQGTQTEAEAIEMSKNDISAFFLLFPKPILLNINKDLGNSQVFPGLIQHKSGFLPGNCLYPVL
jgi:hypothetical protein